MQGMQAPLLRDSDGHQFRDLNKNGKLDIYEDSRQPVEKRVDDLLSQMTLEEKAGLMFSPMMSRIDPGDLSKKTPASKSVSVLEAVAVKHINTFACLGSASPKKFAMWHNAFQKAAERTRLGIPVTLCSDPRHTYTQQNNPFANLSDRGLSSWPLPLGLAASRDEGMVENFARIARQELRAIGIRFALHPVADTATEPRWPRIQETFGEDADLNGRMTAAYIRGFQGESIGNDSVACCVKHFPGGGPQKDGNDPHCTFGKEQVYPGGMFDYHLKPFIEAIKAGAAAMMPYYGVPTGLKDIEEVGFNFNRQITHNLLRQQLGFSGIVHSDYSILTDFKLFGVNIMPARAWGVEDMTLEERLAKAVQAGVDQVGGESCPETLVSLVKDEIVTEGRLDDSCRRILALKFQLGLFDDPYVDAENAEQICGKSEFQMAGEEAMRKSLVLLKNERNGKTILPLSGRPNVYTEGFDLKEVSKYANTVRRIKQADFALIRLQSPYRKDTREFFSRLFKGGDLTYTEKQKKHLDKIMKEKPAIVSVKLLRPAVIPEIAEKAAGIIGEFEVKDHILLDAIFGGFSPTGKLPFDLPGSMQAVEKQKSDVPYDCEDPLYRFGFGLRY
jgi:beta-glucosidase